MVNQIVLVGRIAEPIEFIETDDSKKCTILIGVTQPYKNKDGEYDVDYLRCDLTGNVAINTAEYCKEGDLIGIKGRISGSLNNDENTKNIKVYGDRVTFLATPEKRKQMER